MSYARRLIRQILKVQDMLWDRIPEELREELAKEEGSVGVLEVYDSMDTKANDVIFLKFERGKVVEIPLSSYRHKVSMHIDAFLDLILEEGDFAQYWASGKIKIEGEDYVLHAIKWSKWFDVVRSLLKKYVLGGGEK